MIEYPHCARNGCNEFTYDTYTAFGFICPDCINEFKEYIRKTGLTPKTENEITDRLEVFMDIMKIKKVIDVNMTIDEYFDMRTNNK